MVKTIKKRKRRKSPRVAERRSRIIDKTRQLVGQVGIENVTIRQLADECGVAVATLYNQFGSLDGVLGAALEVDFRGRFEPVSQRTQNLSPADKLNERISVSTREILGQLREYTRSVIFYYFHRTAHVTLRAAIHDFTTSDFQHIVEEIDAHGDLQPWVNPETFADDIITQLYAIVMKWAQGYIKDKDLRSRLIRAAAASFIGISTGKTNESFKKLIAAER